jgi:hypothetical protein
MAGLGGLMVVVPSALFVLSSFTDEKEKTHTVHNVAGIAVYGVILGVGLLLSTWRPTDQIVPFRMVLAVALASAIGGLMGGDFVEGSYYLAPVVAIILLLLHPARSDVVSFARPVTWMLVVALVALVPVIAFSITQSGLQQDALPGDSHGELHHYSGMAAISIGIVLSAIVGSFPAKGFVSGVWLVAIAGAILGATSIAYTEYAGAYETLWAWLIIGWILAWVVAAVYSSGMGRTSEA